MSEPVILTKRTMPERLRYFAAQLLAGADPSSVAIGLEMAAADLDGLLIICPCCGSTATYYGEHRLGGLMYTCRACGTTTTPAEDG